MAEVMELTSTDGALLVKLQLSETPKIRCFLLLHCMTARAWAKIEKETTKWMTQGPNLERFAGMRSALRSGHMSADYPECRFERRGADMSAQQRADYPERI